MKPNDETKVSRRRFLEAAVVAAAVTRSGSAEPAPVDPERERLEALVAKCGSELGELREVK
jgi:hypothetical protein